MPFIPSAFGNILSGFGENLERNRLEQYQREQDALQRALEQRKLDIQQSQVDASAENNALQRMFQQQNYLATQRERQGDDARAWASQAPSGTQLPGGQLGTDVRRLFPTQFESTGLPQLASTAISGVVKAGAPIESSVSDSEIAPPQLMAGIAEVNKAKPGGDVWQGTSLTQNREGNLDARQTALEVSQARLALSQASTAERIALAKQNLDLAERRHQLAVTALTQGVTPLATSEGIFAMPKIRGGVPTQVYPNIPVGTNPTGRTNPTGGTNPATGRTIPIPSVVGGGSLPEEPPQFPSVATPPQAAPQTPVRPPAEGQMPSMAPAQDPDIDPVGMEVIRVLRPPNAAMTADAAKISPLAALLAEQKRLAPLVNTGKGGLESVKGAAQNYKKLLWDKNDPNVIDVQLYQDKYLATLARLSGEVGVLTEPDAQRAKSWIIDLNDSEAEVNRKIAQFENFLTQKIEHLNRYGLTPPNMRRAPAPSNSFFRF